MWSATKELIRTRSGVSQVSDNSSPSIIGKVLDQLQESEDPTLAKQVDKLLSQTYGLLLTFLGDELSPQQRQIWLLLAKTHPEVMSGTELARQIGASSVSKTIYRSIDALKQKGLVTVHQPHPRAMEVRANPGHPLTFLLVDFGTYYGGL